MWSQQVGSHSQNYKTSKVKKQQYELGHGKTKHF